MCRKNQHNTYISNLCSSIQKVGMLEKKKKKANMTPQAFDRRESKTNSEPHSFLPAVAYTVMILVPAPQKKHNNAKHCS